MEPLDLQKRFDVAVVVPTTLRGSLFRAVASVFDQDFRGRIQILIGIDVPAGDAAILRRLAARCPENCSVTSLDLGYSTSVAHGGVYPNRYSGALRTILSYAANSDYVAYLDDDDWWHPEHLRSLLAAIDGKDWAHSLRWFADAETGWPICEDEWDSLGPGKGINAEKFGGFVSTSNLLLNKHACHFVFPYWAMSPFQDGTGEDRLVFAALSKLEKNGGASNRHTCFYSIPSHVQRHAHHQTEFAARKIEWIYDRTLVAELASLEAACLDAHRREDFATAEALVSRTLGINANSAPALEIRGLLCAARGDVEGAGSCRRRADAIIGNSSGLNGPES
jgi:glycosyltransferase involved in cell wall biosynthesis